MLSKVTCRNLTFLLLISLFPTLSYSQDRVHIWLKTFLPNDHPGNPGYIKKTQDGRAVIDEPGFWTDACAMTDNRLFSSDNNASARMTTEFVLIVDEKSANYVPYGGKKYGATGISQKVNCETGENLEAPRQAAENNMLIKPATYTNGIAKVEISGQASYPFEAFKLPTPDINYEGVFSYNYETGNLSFDGKIGVFPAFEAFAQLNDGPISTLFQYSPAKGTTVYNLIEFGTGLNQRKASISVTLQGKVPLNIFRDPRDGQVYKTIIVGSKIWLAENLNYNAPGSFCNNCNEHGRLYTIKGINNAIPPGWRLPTMEEYIELTKERTYDWFVSAADFNLKLAGAYNCSKIPCSFSDLGVQGFLLTTSPFLMGGKPVSNAYRSLYVISATKRFGWGGLDYQEGGTVRLIKL